MNRKLTNLIVLICVFFLEGMGPDSTFAQGIDPIKLSWLGGNPPGLSTGVSWGVPLPEGKIASSTNFSLKNDQGQAMPVQSWPLAYWPDGSLKWIGLSSIVDTLSGATFELACPAGRLLSGQTTEDNLTKTKVEVTETNDDILVNTGVIQCDIPKRGEQLISFIKMDGKEISTGGRLVCIMQNGSSPEVGAQPAKEKFLGKINKATIEQNGPVRAVIKIEGKHFSESVGRSWLPFVIRLYFYAGQQSIRMVHTIVYDGDQQKDFIRGLGLVFDVPMDEQLYNRHIRFSGENGGLWDEPCQPLVGRREFDQRRFDPKKDDPKTFFNQPTLYGKQLTGERIADPDSLNEQQKFLIKHWASWNDFKLQQLNADGFIVKKRTNDKSTWINAGYGKRSAGMAFVGDVSGGITLCVRDFWQSFPSALEIKNVKSDKAQLFAWLWSPEAETMDMRHYDTLAYGHNLDASYEDVQPGFSTATGVGRTSEIMLYVSDNVPSYETLDKIVDEGNQPALLTASSEYIHSIPVFGVWSLPDRSTKGKRWLEDQLDKALEYYQLDVEQRHWYGFWNFGDIRHSYDRERHTWRYDIGGFAWDNTELMPPMWLWYSYLRSGRQDIFRMAEAMTRHSSEVDVYHLGRFNGLGSRHNVVHWGCGAKEVRISQAALGRFYYYLTTDERTGDLMHATTDASNEAIGRIDPLRLILDKSEYPTHVRVGPDWFALVGDWMTEWERTGDTQYRDRIMTGVNSLYEMPYGFFSGKDAAFGYDPATYKLYRLHGDDIGSAHLSVLMGGPEVAYELSYLLKDKKWDKMWMQFCKLYGAPKKEVKKDLGKEVQLGQPGAWYARLPGYYYQQTGNKAYAKRAWDEFLDTRFLNVDYSMKKFEGIQSLQPIFESRSANTNNTAQWCLNAIELLQLAGDQLPKDSPAFEDEK